MAGFDFSKKQGASETAGMVQTFAVDAAHTRRIAPGDVVIITGTSNTNGVSEVDTQAPGVIQTRTTGVVCSVDFTLAGEDLTSTSLARTTAGTLKVYIDPLALFEVAVESGSTLGAGDVGSDVGFNSAEATQSGGLTFSAMTLDATVAQNALFPFRIVALLEDDAGVLGNRALVRQNATTQSVGAAGV